jgi:hypothetical protein
MRLISLFALALCLVTGPVAAHAPQGAEGPVYKPGDGVLAPVLVTLEMTFTLRQETPADLPGPRGPRDLRDALGLL